ncbi:type I 3-dehydroquinate dehydratase [Streptococcus thoraltensis]|uniref:type I 3-dehydroquinate dehydratase n=1 Tax=Streptococcus thoraltensis TaxID=55085 RepID=UPI000360553B|nr:type I 3-dehydroquinate dehydratase [Streptococcus thoraltensis]MDY4762370.1 type I 3-dehydroquinate dehydratase [Streptococcus thoraltensis]
MKIVVPIIPKNLDEVKELDSSKYEGADIIEWRADYLEKDDILRVAPAIFEKFSGYEILFTIRTVNEGGFAELSPEDYISLLKDVDALYHPDYIDFEYFTYKSHLDQLLSFPNLSLSYHNFHETPENLMEIFSELTTLAPRVVKISVMPHNEQEVLDLMNYTRGFKTLNPEQTYATVSMGKLGKLSRISGDVTGSSWSFTSLDCENTSAPGQLKLHDMRRIMTILEED